MLQDRAGGHKAQFLIERHAVRRRNEPQRTVAGKGEGLFHEAAPEPFARTFLSTITMLIMAQSAP